MSYYTPPSMAKCSVIRSRARINLDSITHRSVKDLEEDGYCDPHDPCCVKKDPEIYVDNTVLKGASRIRNACAPKNPYHFEYTILHRLKLRRLLQAAVERQNNAELTEEQLAEIRRLEEEDDSEAIRLHTASTATQKAKIESLFSKNPELNPPPPPKPLLVDAGQLQKSLDGLTNMALAHEIALNKDFQLRKPARSEGQNEGEGELNPQIQLLADIKDKYWSKVEQILQNKDYKQWKHVIIDLLATLKDTLLGCLPADNFQLKDDVHEELDLKKIEKQISKENNNFDFFHYVDFILDTVASLCCPVRDQDVIQIRDIPVLSHRVRKTLELMEEVNLDLANFVLSQSRQHIMQNCIIFERSNFANYIEAQYREGVDPIRITRDWIRRHSLPDTPYNEMMALAFSEVLDWQPGTEWPETLTLDWGRYIPIRHDITRVTHLAVMMMAVHGYAEQILSTDKLSQSNSFELEQVSALKNHRLMGVLREELDRVLIIQHFQDPEQLQQGLEDCANEAVKVVDKHSLTEYCQGIGEGEKEKIREIVKSMTDLNDATRMGYVKKIQEWFLELGKGEGRKKIQTPYSLRIVGALVMEPVMEMIRLMMYNRSVFDVLYREIFDGKCAAPTVYPPRWSVDTSYRETHTLLDANKGLEVETNPETMDGNIMRIVADLRDFKGRTIVYRRSKIDPRMKPMFEADGTAIDPPEMQPDYAPQQMTPLEQKHFDEQLLESEPTLEEDHEGLFGNVGEPDWMFGYTTEQLLQLMERENLVKANKLKRIKDRLHQETLRQRVGDDLPVFNKVWGKDQGTLQKEYCRLQRILEKGPHALPAGATDEPSGRRVFQSTCEQETSKGEDVVEVNEGRNVIIPRKGGLQFGVTPTNSSDGIKEKLSVEDDDDLDIDMIALALAEVKDIETDDYRTANMAHNQFSDGDVVMPETALEKLVRSITKYEPTLDILGMRFRVPQRSTKPVWGRILGSIQKSRESAGRKRYAAMMSLARQIQERPTCSPILPRSSNPKQPTNQYQGNDRGTSVRTVMEMSMGNMMGKTVMISKPTAQKMPATSDMPLATSDQSTAVRRKRNSTAATKQSAAVRLAKFPMAPLSRIPPNSGLIKNDFRNSIYQVDY